MESPARPALVYVNDQLAGPVWRPPYEVDVTKLVRPGQNKIRVVVVNLAINQLAGQTTGCSTFVMECGSSRRTGRI